MLNLSDIRKKAKKDGEEKSSKRPDGQEQDKLAAEEIPEAPPGEPAAAEETSVPSTVQEPERDGAPGDETQAPPPVEEAAPAEPEAQETARDPLEALFDANPELELATEEAYFQGLVGQESETEETLCQLLSFALGEEEYAVDIQDVQEIIKMRETTDIPRVPDFVLGIISLRGNIIPVFDLKRRLQLGTVEPTSSTRIVVCRDGRKAVGLVVDRINQVVRLPERAIEQVSGILSGVNKDLVEGVGRYQGRMLILLDLSSVLTVEQS